MENDGTVSTYYVSKDALGSSSAITSSSGTLLVNENFGAF